LQNYDYDSYGNPTAAGSTDFSGSADVDFDNASINKVDECLTVEDTNIDLDSNTDPNTVCADVDDLPKTFTYSLTFGKHPDADIPLECGPNTHTNIASFVTNDTEATGEDDWTVTANVACGGGCTLTQGYWKTHSHHGPAPEDDAWFLLGDVDGDTTSEGADENFFISGQTYYQVLWTPPAGNAYYILAHQYIAAKLNILNGATSTPAVNSAITFAESFFSSKMPSSSLSKTERKQATDNAATLDKYNNGVTGPGHCSE
jgi:hypothetical protein